MFPLHWIAEILRAKSRDTGLINRVISFLVGELPFRHKYGCSGENVKKSTCRCI